MFKKANGLTLFVVVLLMALFLSPNMARSAENSLVATLTLGDYSGESKVTVNLPMIPGRSEFMLAPGLEARYGKEFFSFGLKIPSAYRAPEDGDSEFALGAPAMDMKLHSCTQGSTSLCYGGSLTLGAGLFELGDNLAYRFASEVDPDNDRADLSRSYERLVLRPMGMLALRSGGLEVQLEAGPSVWLPWYVIENDEMDTEVLLHYHLALSYEVAEWMSPMVEFRGVSSLSEGDLDARMWVNLGVRFDVGQIQPSLRVTIPLGDYSTESGLDDAPVHVALGLSYLFS